MAKASKYSSNPSSTKGLASSMQYSSFSQFTEIAVHPIGGMAIAIHLVTIPQIPWVELLPGHEVSLGINSMHGISVNNN